MVPRLLRVGRVNLVTGGRPVRLFLGGDVMTGRGIDQILRTPSDPRLFEGWIRDARDYVRLAEAASGPIPRRVASDYVWGDLLADVAAMAPDLRIVNLETAVTRSDAAEQKGINYRMHPANAEVLTAAGLDACILANNHVLDWGVPGLIETMDTLRARGIGVAGAGIDRDAAWAPRILPLTGGRRLLLVACAASDSGVPAHWAAGAATPGLALLPEPATGCVDDLAERLAQVRREGDALVVSVHWGGNWGYEVPDWQRRFAHALVDSCAADVVFGHSSHHPKGAERHRGSLILYGCGDLLNDYEGIGGHHEYPADTALAHFVDIGPTPARGVTCRMRPYRIRRMRLERAGRGAAERIGEILERECAALGATATREPGGDILIGGAGSGPAP